MIILFLFMIIILFSYLINCFKLFCLIMNYNEFIV